MLIYCTKSAVYKQNVLPLSNRSTATSLLCHFLSFFFFESKNTVQGYLCLFSALKFLHILSHSSQWRECYRHLIVSFSTPFSWLDSRSGPKHSPIEISRSLSDHLHPVGHLRTSDRPVPGNYTWQHKALTRDKHLWPGGDSNLQSQQASSRRPTPKAARLLGSASSAFTFPSKKVGISLVSFNIRIHT